MNVGREVNLLLGAVTVKSAACTISKQERKGLGEQARTIAAAAVRYGTG